MSSLPPENGDEWTEPPASIQMTTSVVVLGIILTAIAALLGSPSLGGEETPLLGFRVILTLGGLIIAGSAVTMRYQWSPVWLLAGVAGTLAVYGFPTAWDSFRMVARVYAGVSLLGGLIVESPGFPRRIVISILTMLHFVAIMSAVTAPNPQPWLGSQIWTRFARPYLYFTYLNNAYQFYSPDPGPASELWFLIEYEPDQAVPISAIGGGIAEAGVEQETLPRKWIKIPRRPRHFKDPLGQSYYRRLSLTEYATHVQRDDYVMADYLRNQIKQRRDSVQFEIPYGTALNLNLQYREPSESVRLMTFPSYVRHVAHENGVPGAHVKTVHLYRVLHQIVTIEHFVGFENREEEKIPGDDNHVIIKLKPDSVYDPTSYLPYYMGAFDAQGRLIDRLDPMVYWLVPILYSSGARPGYMPSMNHMSDEDYKKYFMDYVNIQTNSNHRKGN